MKDYFDKVKIFLGVRYNWKDLDISEVTKILESRWGKMDFQSDPLPVVCLKDDAWNTPDQLMKVFFTFEYLVDPNNISDIKITALDVEEKNYSQYIKIDVGYVSLKKIILAKHKETPYNVPLQKGIYGEVLGLFKDKNWSMMPWSDQNYRAFEYTSVFDAIRAKLWQQQQQQSFNSPAEFI